MMRFNELDKPALWFGGKVALLTARMAIRQSMEIRGSESITRSTFVMKTLDDWLVDPLVLGQRGFADDQVGLMRRRKASVEIGRLSPAIQWKFGSQPRSAFRAEAYSI